MTGKHLSPIKLGYKLEVDEATHTLLDMLFEAVDKPQNQSLFNQIMANRATRTALFWFQEKLQEGMHEAGWCDDTSCEKKSANRKRLLDMMVEKGEIDPRK